MSFTRVMRPKADSDIENHLKLLALGLLCPIHTPKETESDRASEWTRGF